VASDWQNFLLRQLIYEFKYRFVNELAAPLSQLMIKFLEAQKFVNFKTDKLTDWQTNKLILLPVPLHKRRQLWRGFNQSELLGKIVGGHFDIPVRTGILLRCRHTLPQMSVRNKIERQKNIRGAFMLNEKTSGEKLAEIKNKIIILIDDVSTTAATLEECAKILKPLSPKEIWGLVLTKGQTNKFR